MTKGELDEYAYGVINDHLKRQNASVDIPALIKKINAIPIYIPPFPEFEQKLTDILTAAFRQQQADKDNLHALWRAAEKRATAAEAKLTQP